MRTSFPSVDLRPDHWAIVRSALRRHVPDREVLAFGSRATWTAKDYSDLDLAVMGEEPLSLRTASALDEALRDSDLPFKVDVVDWARIDGSFRAIIRRDAVTVLAPTVSAEAAGPARFEIWTTMPFDEAFLVNPAVPIKRGSPTPFVAMAAIEPGLRTVRSKTFRKFRGSGSRFEDGDTLLARITPCLENGKIARYSADADEEVGHGSTEFIVVRGRPGVTDTKYAFYVTRSDLVRSYAIGQMTGTSGRQRVPPASLAHLEVAVPSLPEQRAIIRILGTLDDKIELNRRMNETLEAMARALFKSWFVDFDPVRAKIEGRETGLPEAIDDLFTDQLVDSELGEIPEGWVVRTLGDVCYKPQYGFTASAQSQPVGPRFLRITDINKKPWVSWSQVPYCRATDDEFSKYRLSKGDVLIARMADPGHGILIEEDLGAIFASYLIRFRPIESRTGRLLQYWLNSCLLRIGP